LLDYPKVKAQYRTFHLWITQRKEYGYWFGKLDSKQSIDDLAQVMGISIEQDNKHKKLSVLRFLKGYQIECEKKEIDSCIESFEEIKTSDVQKYKYYIKFRFPLTVKATHSIFKYDNNVSYTSYKEKVSKLFEQLSEKQQLDKGWIWTFNEWYSSNDKPGVNQKHSWFSKFFTEAFEKNVYDYPTILQTEFGYVPNAI
jgi:hypothetical protein